MAKKHRKHTRRTKSTGLALFTGKKGFVTVGTVKKVAGVGCVAIGGIECGKQILSKTYRDTLRVKGENLTFRFVKFLILAGVGALLLVDKK